MQALAHAVAFALVPAVAMVVGGTVAAFWPPTDRFKSYIQHFAAGIVFSALAVEVLPDVMHRDAPLAVASGFSLGLAVMLAIRRATRGAKGGTVTAVTRGVPVRLLAVVGVDIFVDGLLIGVVLATGNRAGALVTLALAIELFSLGLAVAAAGTAGRARTIRTTALLSTSAVLGAAAGSLTVGGLQGRWMEGLLGFAVAALLYLVTEELLVEAHEVPETPLSTAAFFIGFLALMLIDMAT